jgi:hypothetical protein
MAAQFMHALNALCQFGSLAEFECVLMVAKFAKLEHGCLFICCEQTTPLLFTAAAAATLLLMLSRYKINQHDEKSNMTALKNQHDGVEKMSAAKNPPLPLGPIIKKRHAAV